MARCGQGAVRVIQIASCDVADWRAVFLLEDGALGTEPVACWLLVDHDGDQHLHPAVPMGVEVCDATYAGNYLGVVPPGVDPATLREPTTEAAP